MSVELWLIRHGETEWSLSGAHTSRTDIPLTDHGRRRAQELRDFLKGTEFAKVFVSPMQRARETCAIAGYTAQATVEPLLMEWDYGESEGKTTKEMRAKYGDDWSVWNSPINGGETVEHVGERAEQLIAKALNGLTEGRVACFAHAHILRITAARWISLEARAGQSFGLGTGSLSILGWERENRVISRWNREFE